MRKLLLVCVLFLAGCAVPADKLSQSYFTNKLPPGAKVLGTWGDTENLWIEFEATFSTDICHCVMHYKSVGNATTESMIILDKRPRQAEQGP